MNHIEAAVAHLKNDAMDRAEQFAKNLVDRIYKNLEEHGWDVDKAAPRPGTNVSREVYVNQMSIHNLYLSVTTYTQGSRRHGDPNIRKASSEAVERFIAEARKDAAFQYDMYVAKLIKKIGDVVSADLNGNHVWGESFLTVKLATGEVQRWKTQTIINMSKLGKVFNQFPTRKVKI